MGLFLILRFRRFPMTRAERQRQKTLPKLPIETAEGYERKIECDRELYQVIALDAKGSPHGRITTIRPANPYPRGGKGDNRSRSPATRSIQTDAHGPLPLRIDDL
ncbi:hypothetical protein R69927_03457 [Paraburkholderia domus]|nr:hypothetical protein R70006_01113 [Paraburkholderia domus]CAE6817466.1 hypothetical protein R69749_03371 [Paraburkholderia domus]CAE6868706.1 hypothetical protein R75471_00768 [Paraburkholderia domus]CAE6871785.1 hypothetical protein R69927_03457 [Paraburkholderia domus]CAE6878208.1 hypothetical protein R70199_02342 [Paraburkholderia domus]